MYKKLRDRVEDDEENTYKAARSSVYQLSAVLLFVIIDPCVSLLILRIMKDI